MWGTSWQYYTLAGFYLSKRLCGRYVYTDSGGDEQSGKISFKKDPPDENDDDTWYLDTDDYRRLSFGIQLGGGIRRQIGPGFLAFNILFGMGFCDFYKWENSDSKPDGYKPYNDRNINFQLGYTYPIER